MGFAEAVQSGFNNYANFSGRATRSAYWYWVLFQVVLSIAASIIDSMVGGVGILNAIVGLGLLLPSLAVGVRRLHDIGKSGWNILWALIPILGALYLLYLYVQPSSPEANAYGPAPGMGAPATS
jgi:uncharacterized membrane protein YhaH (DUF805 family)